MYRNYVYGSEVSLTGCYCYFFCFISATRNECVGIIYFPVGKNHLWLLKIMLSSYDVNIIHIYKYKFHTMTLDWFQLQKLYAHYSPYIFPSMFSTLARHPIVFHGFFILHFLLKELCILWMDPAYAQCILWRNYDF